MCTFNAGKACVWGKAGVGHGMIGTRTRSLLCVCTEIYLVHGVACLLACFLALGAFVRLVLVALVLEVDVFFFWCL